MSFLRPSVFRSVRPASFIRTSRLLSTLAIIEHRGGSISSASLPVVSAATKLGGPVTAFVAGSDAQSVAEQAGKLAGVEKVLTVSNGAYDKV